MKFFRIALVVLVLLANLLVAFPSWAKTSVSSITNPDYFEVGQKVIWLYKARADSDHISRIPGEVSKLGSRQVQIKVYKHNKEFVYRWVNRDKLENSH
jgi:hypothetical protein